MNDIRQIIAENLVELRKLNKYTQLEVGEKLNYSDKAVSKWEHGESLPDVEVLCQIAELYEVSLDYLVTRDHGEETKQYAIGHERRKNNKLTISLLATSLVWLFATIAYFYTFIISNQFRWIYFIWSVPFSTIMLFVFNCVWGKRKYGYILLSVFIWTLLASFYLEFLRYNFWLIFILGVPTQIIIFLWQKLK